MATNRDLPHRRRELRRAVTLVSKLKGSSQPCEIMTTGAVLYVVKIREVTGQHGLAAEVIGNEIMTQLGLPVPEWAPVEISREFIESNPELWYRSANGAQVVRPAAGIHFGSRLTLSPGAYHTYDVIPESWVTKIVNREDFVGALLVDLWTNNCDRRQAIFLHSDDSRLHAVFVDNDHMFGGYYGNERTTARRVIPPSVRAIYRDCWLTETVAGWKRRIDAISERTLDAMVQVIPGTWATEPVRQRLKAELVVRRRRLDSMIREVDEVLEVDSPSPIRTPIQTAERWMVPQL